MEYRVKISVVDNDGDIVYEGENVRITLDDGCILVGTIGGIFDREKILNINCEYFTLNIGVGRITSITKE